MEIWTAKAILAPLPGDHVLWSGDPLATGAWNAGSGTPDGRGTPGGPKAAPAKRKSWRSFLWGVSIGSTALCAGLVALMASGVLMEVSPPDADRRDINAAAVTPASHC